MAEERREEFYGVGEPQRQERQEGQAQEQSPQPAGEERREEAVEGPEQQPAPPPQRGVGFANLIIAFVLGLLIGGIVIWFFRETQIAALRQERVNLESQVAQMIRRQQQIRAELEERLRKKLLAELQAAIADVLGTPEKIKAPAPTPPPKPTAQPQAPKKAQKQPGQQPQPQVPKSPKPEGPRPQ